jgi:eukaryotic-like serine/threonine-protein kinase
MRGSDPEATASDTDGAPTTSGESPTRRVDPLGLQDHRHADERALSPGQQVDRYVVLRELGRGGMAVVYAAFDPQLDRRIALKVMRRVSDARAKEAAQRLHREAQALARLSHPNVIRVYDVGVFEGTVYLTMELVEGRTLRAWLDEETPPWRRALEVVLAAGDGLAAAHRVGLVHLDFKPSNVLIGHDGRVKVADFGLAREPRGSARSRDLDEGDEAGIDAERIGADLERSSAQLSEPLTELGAVIGTPGYIAPEQLQGLEADARSDQFAFCVTLWQALYSERPFAGEDRRALEGAVLRGEIRTPSDTAGVPGGWRR